MSIEEKEKFTQLTPISTLRFIVHPMFMASGHKDPSKEELAAEKNLFNLLVNGGVPNKSDELTLFMPKIKIDDSGNWDRKDFRREYLTRLEFADEPNWLKLLYSLKRNTLFPQNILVTKNLNNGITLDNTLKLLEKHKFSVDSATRIVIMGEWQDLCVSNVARLFLDLPNVTEVEIDSTLSFPYSDLNPLTGIPYFMTEDSQLPPTGYTITNNQNRYIISKISP